VKALGGVYGYVMQSSLPAVLVDLVYLRISQINKCAYCLDKHTRDLLKKGQKIEKVAPVQAWAEGGNLFDERERAALAWAETVSHVAETGVPDEAYQAARAVFEERELVYLTIAISLMNVYNRMAISFRNRDRDGGLTGPESPGLSLWTARLRGHDSDKIEALSRTDNTMPSPANGVS